MIRVNFTRIIIKLNDVLQECKVGGSKVDGCKIGGRKARFLAERTQHPQNSHIAENGVDLYIIYYNLYRGGKFLSYGKIVYYQDVSQLPVPLNTLHTIHLNTKSHELL